MILLRSEIMGFCAGVNRAVGMLEKAIDMSRKQQVPVYTIGPLIHNRRYLEAVEARGVRIIRNPEEGEPGLAVIRAHGIEPADKERFKRAGFQLLDGTCGRVNRSQNIVQHYADAGWSIIIAGDEGHGEVKSILAHISEKVKAAVVKDTSEAEFAVEALWKDIRQTAGNVPVKNPGMLLIAQTTFSPAVYQNIQQTLQNHSLAHQYPLEIIDSICPATMQRQEALKRLCDAVNAVIVIGGKSSANTRRLYERALHCGVAAWHISGAEELPEAVFGYQRVGLTAGASTPAWIIDEVAEALQRSERLQGSAELKKNDGENAGTDSSS